MHEVAKSKGDAWHVEQELPALIYELKTGAKKRRGSYRASAAALILSTRRETRYLLQSGGALPKTKLKECESRL